MTGRRLIWLTLLIVLRIPSLAQDRLPDSVNTTTDSVVVDENKTQYNTDSSGVGGATVADTVPSADDPAVVRIVPDSDFAAYRRDPKFAYAFDPAYWQKNKPVEPSLPWWYFFLESTFWRYFFYIILALVLGYALYRIITDNRLHLFYRSPRADPSPTIDGDDPMITGPELDIRIREAVQQGNLRLAVRFQFIKTLRLMDEQEHIRYQTKATNEDYFHQLGSTRLAVPFRYLARAYEYVWYGGFEPSGSQYAQLSRAFDDMHQQLAA